MPSTHSLIYRLASDYPDIIFVEGSSTTMWNPSSRAIHYSHTTTQAELLHEVGHALLGHGAYERDIDLLSYERDAWDEASRLSSTYGISIDSDIIQRDLDTYRDWLHARSCCPTCQTNGIQLRASIYKCLSCQSKWQVNDARTHNLRRNVLK